MADREMMKLTIRSNQKISALIDDSYFEVFWAIPKFLFVAVISLLT